MNLDLISAALGAGITLLTFVLSIPVVLALHRPQSPREPDPYTCGCAHSLAVHDPETNRCNATVEVQKYNQFNSPAGKDHRPCACRQYVGERPIDPEALLDKFIRDHSVPLNPPAPQDRT
jgi:hypothetical protein